MPKEPVTTLDAERFAELLENAGACSDAKEFAAGLTFAQAYDKPELRQFQFLGWLLEEMSAYRYWTDDERDAVVEQLEKYIHPDQSEMWKGLRYWKSYGDNRVYGAAAYIYYTGVLPNNFYLLENGSDERNALRRELRKTFMDAILAEVFPCSVMEPLLIRHFDVWRQQHQKRVAEGEWNY